MDTLMVAKASDGKQRLIRLRGYIDGQSDLNFQCIHMQTCFLGWILAHTGLQIYGGPGIIVL